MILFYCVSTLITGILLWGSYQVFLHPLRNYPGPWVAKFSDIYSGFHAYRRSLHLTTWNNQSKYGPVIRQGPNKLVFNSVTALRDIYKSDRTTKPKAYMALGPGLTTYNIFSAVDNTLHRSRRQLIGQVLTERSMRVFEPVMIDQIKIFLRNVLQESQNSNPINMTKQTRKLAINIAGLLAFGYDLRLQTEEENQFMHTVLDGGTFASSILLQYPLIRELRLGILLMFPLFSLRETYLDLMEKIIKSRTALPKNAKHDLYSVVADVLGAESSGLRESDLWSEANLFLSAAGETVKTALSAAFFYLSRNKTAYQKLADEIRSNFTSGGEIRGSTVTPCEYLRACIDEALRLSPPVPGILWRDISPEYQRNKQPFIVDGHVIPRGTSIGINVYSLHHKEDYFPDPFSFKPDRWLNSSPNTKRIMREAFNPFSLGPRGCAGKSMAYLEASLVLGKTLWYFDFEAAPGELGGIGAGTPGLGKSRQNSAEFQLHDIFGAGHDGPYLEFKARGNFWKEL